MNGVHGNVGVNAFDRTGMTVLRVVLGMLLFAVTLMLFAWQEAKAALINRANEQLLDAAAKGMPGAVESALANGADINVKDATGATPLIIAARADDLQTSKLLLHRGARVNVCAPGWGTALTRAAILDDIDLVRALLDEGADPNLAAPRDASPLQECAMGSDDARAVAVARALIQAGGDPRYTDGRGYTAAEIARADGNLMTAKTIEQFLATARRGDAR